VAILYGGSIFACRRCYRLAYASSHEDSGGRGIKRRSKSSLKISQSIHPPGSPSQPHSIQNNMLIMLAESRSLRRKLVRSWRMEMPARWSRFYQSEGYLS
jgi:hypothetical protein